MGELSQADQELMEQIWREQSAPQAPYQDLTRLWPLEPDQSQGPAPRPEDVTKLMAEALGWPDWVRLYTKPALAVVGLRKLAVAKGLPGGVLFSAPGTGAPLQPPNGEPGMMLLRGDWAPDAKSMTYAQAEARARGLMLVVDESATGFRLSRGGATEYFELEPDVVMFGPLLAGGLPLGLAAGRGEAPEEPKKEPSPEALQAAATLIPRLADPDLAPRLADLGRRLVQGLNYFLGITGQAGQVRLSGPSAMPRLEGPRLWAFINLAREEGLGLGPVLMPNLSLDGHGLEHAWRRLARTAARLRITPEGQKGAQGWKEAFQPNTCPRVEEILAQFDKGDAT